MRRIILIIALMLANVAAMSQIKVPGTRVTFDFPNQGWKFLKTITVDKTTTVYLYSYTGEKFVDPSGEKTPPFMRVYVKKNYTDDILNLAYARFLQQPFQSINEYFEGLPAEGGIGYLGAYTSTTDETDYKFQMIYFKDKNNAIEIRLETTIDTYDKMEKEFDAVRKTVKIVQ